MAEQADAQDLKSCEANTSYRFDPGLGHHFIYIELSFNSTAPYEALFLFWGLQFELNGMLCNQIHSQNPIKQVGANIIIISATEAFGADILVILSLIKLDFNIKLSIMSGEIAAAATRAQIIIIIQQYNLKGPLPAMHIKTSQHLMMRSLSSFSVLLQSLLSP